MTRASIPILGTLRRFRVLVFAAICRAGAVVVGGRVVITTEVINHGVAEEAGGVRADLVAVVTIAVVMVLLIEKVIQTCSQ